MKSHILIAAWCIASASLSTQAMHILSMSDSEAMELTTFGEVQKLPLFLQMVTFARDGGKVFPPSAAVEEKDGKAILEITLQRKTHFSGEGSKLKSISATYVEQSLLEAFNAEFSGKRDRAQHQGVSISYEFSEKHVDTITFTFSLDDYSDEFIDTLCHKLIHCPKTWN